MGNKPMVAAGVVAATGTYAAVAVDGVVINMGLAEAGPWALLIGTVALVLTSIFRGWIIVKIHYDTLLDRAVAAESANVRLAETNSVLVNTNDVQARTIEKQAAVGDTVERVMGAIQDARASAGGSP